MERIVVMDNEQAELLKSLVQIAYKKGLDEGFKTVIFILEKLNMPPDLLGRFTKITEQATAFLTKEAEAQFNEAWLMADQSGKRFMQRGDKSDV